VTERADDQVEVEAPVRDAVTAFLRHGLARTIEAGRTGKVALALWRGDEGTEAPLVLEACRALGEEGPSAARLADLWALPIGETRAEPRPHRRDDRAESVLIGLPLVPEPGAPLLAEKWRDTFRDRYILHVRDVLFDTERLRASLGTLGLEAEFVPTAEAGLSLARARADVGRRVDMVLLDAHPLGGHAIELARALRTDPRLADAIIVLAGQRRGEKLDPDNARLFDALPSGSRRWQRLIEVFRDLIEARSGGTLAAPAAAERPEIPDLAGNRILVAEDVATNQVLLRAIVEPTGGDAVVARQAAEPADLVIMDLQMPGMGGLAAARRIRALPGAAGAVPIVALTAYTSSTDRQRAIEAGMNAYLAKPVVVAEVYDVLRRLLGPEQAEG